MNSFTSTLNPEKKIKIDKQGNYFMKSVIAQGSTIAKAIEEALKKADMPQEFFVKVLEDAQSGFLGFGSKKAKIALFFKNVVLSDKTSENMFSKGSYAGLFNNSDIKKQLDQQLKELGFEVKAMDTKKQEQKPIDIKKQEQRSQEQKPKVIKKDFTQNPVKISNLQIRPLLDKSQIRKPFVPKTSTDVLAGDTESLKDQDNQNQQQAKTGENKHRRYYRYRRNRYNKDRSNTDSGGLNSNNSNIPDRDE